MGMHRRQARLPAYPAEILRPQCRGNYSLDSVFRIRRAPRAPYLSGTTNDASSSSIAQAFPTANVSGNLIVSAISWDSNASVTCSDSQSNSYAVATTQYDSVNNQSLAICYAANVKSGTNTVTATFSSFSEYRRLLIHEYKGIASVNPLDVVAKNVANGTIETLL